MMPSPAMGTRALRSDAATEEFMATTVVTQVTFTTLRGYKVWLATYLLPRWRDAALHDLGVVHFAELDAALKRWASEPPPFATLRDTGTCR